MITDVFHYTTSRWDWHDGDVNQMWIQEIEESPDCYRYIAVAYNPRKDTSMVMSNPREEMYKRADWAGSYLYARWIVLSSVGLV